MFGVLYVSALNVATLFQTNSKILTVHTESEKSPPVIGAVSGDILVIRKVRGERLDMVPADRKATVT